MSKQWSKLPYLIAPVCIYIALPYIYIVLPYICVWYYRIYTILLSFHTSLSFYPTNSSILPSFILPYFHASIPLSLYHSMALSHPVPLSFYSNLHPSFHPSIPIALCILQNIFSEVSTFKTIQCVYSG